MPAYAAVAEFEAYVEGWVTDNGAALDRLLERASRDLDNLVFVGRWPLTTGAYAGHTIDPTVLTDVDADALSRATCAQAEFRFAAGETDWASAGHGGRVKGPDFEVDLPKAPGGGQLRLAPKAGLELQAIRHLWQSTVRARG